MRGFLLGEVGGRIKFIYIARVLLYEKLLWRREYKNQFCDYDSYPISFGNTLQAMKTYKNLIG